MLGRKKKELHGKSDTLFMHAFAYQKCLNEDSSPQLLSYAKCFRLLISISSCNKEEFGCRYHKLCIQANLQCIFIIICPYQLLQSIYTLFKTCLRTASNTCPTTSSLKIVHGIKQSCTRVLNSLNWVITLSKEHIKLYQTNKIRY